MLTKIRFFDDGTTASHSYEDYSWPSICLESGFGAEAEGFQVWLVEPVTWDRVLVFSEGKTSVFKGGLAAGGIVK